MTLRAVIGTVCVTLALAGCAGSGRTVVAGRAVSMLYDPARVGGLSATNGPSGPRGPAAPVTARVGNTDGGEIDRLALSAINDIEDFWTQHYADSLRGTFTPISTLLSYDSTDPASPPVCGAATYGLRNAMYCHPDDVMAWDRGKFLPTARKYFGDMAINGTLAHEYGHAVQWMAGLIERTTPTLVREQQADCFAGVYLQWVAAGSSPRDMLSTGDGLNHVLAGLIVIRDPLSTPDNPLLVPDEHGTALDRIGAFQAGFDGGAEICAGIDMSEIGKRRGDLPSSLFAESTQSDIAIDGNVLSTLMAQLGQIFAPASPPTLSTLSTGPGDCPSGQQATPAAYCPASNAVVVDLPALQQMSTPSDESVIGLPQGDNTGLSVVTSRYVLAVQRERGVALDSATAALRTACLTGVAQRRMAEPTGGGGLILAGGDLDEAVTGLLLNGVAASNVNGDTVPAGFTRILAFRSGLHADTEQCFQRFP
ncbi:MAG TPA: neutral zinc metallopeptidase [Mycobacterium sp.]|nr:neutral zinc metallopeptidase [Mycobacterium sp.]